MNTPAAPQGIDAILSALSTGGLPNGNIANLPAPAVPQGALPAQPGIPSMPGMPQAGAMDPLAGGMNELNPEMLQMIIQALMQGGAFNGQPQGGIPTQPGVAA